MRRKEGCVPVYTVPPLGPVEGPSVSTPPTQPTHLNNIGLDVFIMHCTLYIYVYLYNYNIFYNETLCTVYTVQVLTVFWSVTHGEK
jgi:hypothetical protein